MLAAGADKRRFAFSPPVYVRLFREIVTGNYDVVLMPIEKKHLPLILLLAAARRLIGFRLVSYNHPLLRSSDGKVTAMDWWLTRLAFRLYDRVVFYTEEARDWAVAEGLIDRRKAFFANNTLDTATVWEHYQFSVNRSNPKRVVFIGRLVKNKRLDLLLDYYRALKLHLPDLRLEIIGDGPQAHLAERAAVADPQITWHGAIVDERRIAEIMKRSHVVFVPGHSGLSVVHAFCYGRPYLTCADYPAHPPEICYLDDAVNGLLLSGDNIASDVPRILRLLADESEYARFCTAAFETAKHLSVENWCRQMSEALRGHEG